MTTSEIKARLYQYTPAFIVENELLDDLYETIATTLSSLSEAIENLPDADWEGKGLLKNIGEHQIITNSNLTEAELQLKLEGRFTENIERGTEEGIRDDIEILIDEELTRINFYDITDIGDGSDLDMFMQSVLDCYKAIEVLQAVDLLQENSGRLQLEDGFYLLCEGEVNQSIEEQLATIYRQVIPLDIYFKYKDPAEMVYEVINE